MDSSLVMLFSFTSFFLVLCLYFGVRVFPYRDLSEETKNRSRSFVSNAFFREYWYFVMKPLKNQLIAWEVSPNTLSWAGFIFSALAGYCFAQSNWGWGGWMLILAATCDVYDGLLARAQGITRKSGAFLDSVLDRMGEAALFCGLAWAFREDAFWFAVLFLAFTSSQLVSYSRARAEGLGFEGARGVFQRAERMIVLCVGMAFTPLVDYFFKGMGAYLVSATLLFLCAGSLQTAFVRCKSIYYEIRQAE